MNILNTYDALRAPSITLWNFKFGAYAETNVYVWGMSLTDALEEAASWLAENEPGHFFDLEEGEDEYDLTYTESGYLISDEWGVDEVNDEEIYAEVWEETIDELAESGSLDEIDIERVNEIAEKLDIDSEWELEQENPPKRFTEKGKRMMRHIEEKGRYGKHTPGVAAATVYSSAKRRVPRLVRRRRK